MSGLHRMLKIIREDKDQTKYMVKTKGGGRKKYSWQKIWLAADAEGIHLPVYDSKNLSSILNVK